jgi:adenosylhomocysteine nucleosidase
MHPRSTLDFPRSAPQDARMVFQPFLQSWLRGAAGQKVRETLFNAAREQISASQGSAEDAAAIRERPCDVGLIYALETESGGLEDLLDGGVTYQGNGFTVRQGGLQGRHVAIARSGAGCKAAAAATEAILSGHQPPWIISAGFAGGLVDQVQRYDLVIGDRVMDTAGAEIPLDVQLDPAALAQMPGVHVGRLLCADRIIRLPQEKRSLGEKHQALAVDMETLAVAEVCRRRQIPFLAIRVIIDAVDDQLPSDVNYLLKQKSTASRLGAAFGAILNRPGSFTDLLKLKEQALVAGDRLAKFLSQVIQAIAPLAPPSA